MTLANNSTLVGLLAVILAGCAVPYREHQPEWGGISREVGRNLNTR